MPVMHCAYSHHTHHKREMRTGFDLYSGVGIFARNWHYLSSQFTSSDPIVPGGPL